MMAGSVRATLVLVLLCLAGCSAAPASGRSGGPTPSAAGSTSAASSPSASEEAIARWSVERIDAEVQAQLVGRTWHRGCPVSLHDLRLVTVRDLGFDGEVHAGPLVLHELVADDVQWVFRRLFRHDFPIRRVALARPWRPTRPSDWFSTSDVTASFNCRPVTNGTTLSQHSYGWAVDINPLENPYVNGDGTVLRRAARAYVDRSRHRAGMIHAGDLVVRSFRRIGWSWGGDWHSLKDYMHFSLTGT
jgi:hypothetical protein